MPLPRHTHDAASRGNSNLARCGANLCYDKLRCSTSVTPWRCCHRGRASARAVWAATPVHHACEFEQQRVATVCLSRFRYCQCQWSLSPTSTFTQITLPFWVTLWPTVANIVWHVHGLCLARWHIHPTVCRVVFLSLVLSQWWGCAVVVVAFVVIFVIYLVLVNGAGGEFRSSLRSPQRPRIV